MVLERQIYNNFVTDFNKHLYETMNQSNYSQIVFFCVGTDRITGDSFRTISWTKVNRII